MTNTMVGTQTMTIPSVSVGRQTMTIPSVNVGSQTMTIPSVTAGSAAAPAAKPARSRVRSRRVSRNVALFFTALIIAVFALVGLSAYAASIQHANNVLEKENAYLQAEIDSLNSQIVEETKVTKVESIATNDYGMVYPTSDNCIVINENEESSTSLASTIKHEAYN